MTSGNVWRDVWNLLHKRNRNWLGVITGKPGTGKSWSGIEIGEAYDKRFTVDNIVFTPKDFLELLDEVKRYSFIVFDEAGSGLSARKWQSLSNTLVADEIETFRYLNLGVIFTLPVFNFFDIKPRRLTSTLIETIALNDNTDIVRAKWKNINTDVVTGDIWPTFQLNPFTGRKVKTVTIPKASDDLLEQYETKKRKYLKKRRKLAIEALGTIGAEEEEINFEVENEEFIDDIVNDYHKYLSQKGGPYPTVSIDKLAARKGWKDTYSRRIKIFVDDKLRENNIQTQKDLDKKDVEDKETAKRKLLQTYK